MANNQIETKDMKSELLEGPPAETLSDLRIPAQLSPCHPLASKLNDSLPLRTRMDGQHFVVVNEMAKADSLKVDNVLTSRYEYKFHVSEARARDLVHYLTHVLHFEPDFFTQGVEHAGYQIYSLYLDTPGLTCYRQTKEHKKNRYKCRIRFYESGYENATFIEVKQKYNEAGIKPRARVKRSAIRDFLNSPFRDYLYTQRPFLQEELDGILAQPIGKSFEIAVRADKQPILDAFGEPIILNERNIYSQKDILGLDRFMDRCHPRQAMDEGNNRLETSAYTIYRRAAFENILEGNRVRVTFDRDIHSCRYTGDFEDVFDITSWKKTRIVNPATPVIFELKFDDHPPRKMIEMCQMFQLKRTNGPKYRSAVEAEAGRDVAIHDIRDIREDPFL